SGDAITITAGASDVVNLRGLTIVGAGGVNGITFHSGGALNIQNCVIRGFKLEGLELLPTVSTDINVSNTITSGNGAGMELIPSGTALTVTASFEQVQAIHNPGGTGFFVAGGSMTGSLHVIAADTLASGNGGGFTVQTSAGKAATVFTLTNSK